MQAVPLKLAPGSDLRLTIENSTPLQGQTGFVLGVVGNLSRACFQCPGRSDHTVLEGNLEIITLNGTFAPDGVHLHLSLSDGDCQVWGGHLEIGTHVLKGADVLCGITSQKNITSINKQENNVNNINARIEIAVMPGCPWSSRAVRRLKSLDIPHIITLIDTDEDFKLINSRSGISTFPQIYIDGKFIGGFESLINLESSGELFKFK